MSGRKSSVPTHIADELNTRENTLIKQASSPGTRMATVSLEFFKSSVPFIFHVPRTPRAQQFSLRRSLLLRPRRWSLSVETSLFVAGARRLLIWIWGSLFRRTPARFCCAAEFSSVRHSPLVNLSLHHLKQQT